MNDQNQFDQLKQKFLHYWSIFIAACGRAWEKVKTHAGNAAGFLRSKGTVLAQKLGVWLEKAKAWLGKTWKALRKQAEQLLRKLAAFALTVREKCRPAAQKCREWLAAAAAWFAGIKAKLPAPVKKERPAAAEQLNVEEERRDTEEEALPYHTVQTPVKLPIRKPVITDPTLLKIFAVLGIIGKYLKLTIKWIWKLRTVFMAIPVVWAAVTLAMQNMVRLPESVGLDIQASGEFARMITREEAVYWPLGLTAFCLVLMFCSKKPLLPWVVSIFTLVMPVLIWVLNSYA